MGADFKEKAKKSFEKSWDKAAVAANTPDLFRKATEGGPLRYEAELIGDASAAVGDTCYGKIENGQVIGRIGISPVLTIAAPTPGLLQSISAGCDIARINIVAADPISGVLEVTVH